jgi:hypothetical protein
MVPRNAREHATPLPTRGRSDDGGRSFDEWGEESDAWDRGGVEETDSLTLEVAARDYVWLYDLRRGIGCQKIAIEDGVTVRDVREGIERARKLERKWSRDNVLADFQSGRGNDLGFHLIPMFPIVAFTPQSACRHGGESIKHGSRFCCMVCHVSGMDGHPGLRRDPATDPAPELESQPAAAPAMAEPSNTVARRETRRERRRRLFEAAGII